MIVTAGKTNVSVYFYVVGDASHANPGDPVTALAFGDIETGGDASYMRQGAARVDAGTVITQTVAGAHSDGGFVEVDATDMPGVYRFDPPDAAFATGVDQVVIQIVIAAANNAVAAPILVDITDFDTRNAKVTVEALDADVITAAAIAANAIGSSELAANAINSTVIADNALTANKIATDAITAAKIADNAIGASELATDCIASDQLAATAVTDIWAKVVETEGSYTGQQVMSILLSVLAGETNTGGTIFRTPNDVATRVSATVDASDNRTAMTLTPSS